MQETTSARGDPGGSASPTGSKVKKDERQFVRGSGRPAHTLPGRPHRKEGRWQQRSQMDDRRSE